MVTIIDYHMGDIEPAVITSDAAELRAAENLVCHFDRGQQGLRSLGLGES